MDLQKNANTANLAKFLIFGLNFLTFVSALRSAPRQKKRKKFPERVSLTNHQQQSLGVLLLAMSLWVRSDSDLWVYTDNLEIERYYRSCYFGMAAGGLLFLISFVGCMGALLDSRLLFAIVSSTLCLASLRATSIRPTNN